MAPTAEDPAECVTRSSGYHSRLVLKALDDGPWKSRISEPKQKGFARWHGDDAARRAITINRTRLLSGVADPGSLQAARRDRRALLCPQPRSRRRCAGPGFGAARTCTSAYLLHVAGHNLSLLSAPTHRRRHPEGGRGGRQLAPGSCLLRPLEPSWSFRSSSSSRRMAKPPSPRYASPWRETRSMTPFSTGC